MKTLLKVLILVALIGPVSSCATRTATKNVSMTPWRESADGSYIYRQDPDQLLVLTEQAKIAEKAAIELGCKPCSIRARGTVFELRELK